MEQQILQELEAAAKVILAAPPLISHEQRTKAEDIFLSFRRNKCPYQICRYIFENSRIDYVVFETCNTLKEALIREWNSLDRDDVNSIRDYLLQHVLNHPNTPVYVREKILQVIAIMIKRGSMTDQGAERRKLLGQVEQLIMSGELRKQTLGCSIICALLQEYSSTVKSADIGLLWEHHLSAKKQFEVSDLKSIFQLCVRSLSEVCKVDGSFTENAYMLIKSLLQIAEGVLMWAFIPATMPKKVICIFEMSYESELYSRLKLGQHWKDIMLVPSLVQLFFHLHWKIRNNAHLTHYSLNCLVQLAQLDGPIISEKKVRMEYIKNYIECLLGFLNNVEVVDREAIGISNIFYKLLVYNEQTIINDVGENEQGDLVPNFFRQMARLTCHFAEKASLQDSMNYDESMFIEAFDNMLKAWSRLFKDHSETIFKEASKCIFDSYLRWHLSPPHGPRTKVSTVDVDDSEDEEDLNKFGTQLQCMGIFARQVIGHALPTLAKLIDEKTYELRLMWQGASNNNIQRDDLYEDLHWLLMIAGHVLAKEDDSPVAMIPPNIVKYSIEKMPTVNINDSLSLLTTIDRPITRTDYSRLEESTDHVIWLVSSVFRLSELEKQMGEAKLAHLMSPTLSSTIAWFLQTWANPYLLFSENQLNLEGCPLTSAFGQRSDFAKWVVDFILNKIQSNLYLFNADPSITLHTCELFLSLVRTKEKAVFMVENNFFWNIIDNGLRSNNRYVSPDIKKMLMKGFMLAIAPFYGNDEKRREYLDQILKPVIDKFRNIIMEDNFKKQYHDEMVRSEIMEIVYLLQGVVDGNGLTVCKSLFEYVAPILPDMVSLISIYHNYQQITQIVLELFRECSHFMLCDFPAESVRAFHESCLCLVEVYVKHNTGRLTEEVNAEEDSFNDMLIFIDLLTNLLSKDIIASNWDEEVSDGQVHVTSIDVCMLGLRGILPLMSVETLKFPTLCSRFYRLLTFICELHADKVYAQPQEFLVNILAVIELGLRLFGAEITTLCCEFIQAFSKYLCLNAAQLQSEKFLLLQPFLKIMMSIVLSRGLNSENYRAFGLAFHSLICCYKDCYMQLVEELISNQTEPEIAERLSNAFTDLTTGLRLSYDRVEKITFENNFERFVFVVQGFLFIK